LRVVFAGTPEFALPALEALTAPPHQVVGVLTQPDRPRGRGRKLAPGPVKERALELGLPLSQPATLRDEAVLAGIAAWRPDVLVVVAYGLILPPAILSLPRFGCLNIHASLLPRWRGAAPIQRAILAGDARSGVSIMLMDAGLDTGPILLERGLAIARGATSGALHAELARLGASAVLEALSRLAAGTGSPQPQPIEGVTYAAKIDKSEALISWRDDALVIERQVLAFNPWPVAETQLEGDTLRIFAAHALEDSGGARESPGTIFEVQPEALLVRCGRGVLALTELQRAGRKRLAAREFARAGALTGKRLG
jgi:methionyl-tRNA formyltransferase